MTAVVSTITYTPQSVYFSNKYMDNVFSKKSQAAAL